MPSFLPYAPAGTRIGLLGGSFDPPHAGHVHISRQAMARFGLDQVWWLVSPGNPLKADATVDYCHRIAACRVIAGHPRIMVSDLERRIGTRHTAQTLAYLLRHLPAVRFVWLMGADNLAQFNQWDNWRRIMASVPLGVLGRSGNMVRAGLSPTARIYEGYRLRAGQSGALPFRTAPCWCLVNGATVNISSSRIRGDGCWGGARLVQPDPARRMPWPAP